MHGQRSSGRIAAVIPVFLIVLVFVFELCSFHVALCGGEISLEDWVSSPRWIGSIVFVIIWTLALWSYLQCACTKPGFVPADWFAQNCPGVEMPKPPEHIGWNPGVVTMCTKCKFPRPERAHHCRICGRCVIRYDHHCPWLGNCIGLENHKFFILHTIYVALACLAFLIISFPDLMIALHEAAASTRHRNSALGLVFLGGYSLAIIFGVFTFFLSTIHVRFAMRNVTTVESNFVTRNPYARSSRYNLEELFGPLGWRWIMPVRRLNSKRSTNLEPLLWHAEKL